MFDKCIFIHWDTVLKHLKQSFYTVSHVAGIPASTVRKLWCSAIMYDSTIKMTGILHLLLTFTPPLRSIPLLLTWLPSFARADTTVVLRFSAGGGSRLVGCNAVESHILYVQFYCNTVQHTDLLYICTYMYKDKYVTPVIRIDINYRRVPQHKRIPIVP